ncbi:NAD(P)-binding protein [Auricularia subglabra TFB-10046 SS5]|nr:NAD(P)-binding protein [Auricularia subglabra TFB-10046 SS5]
MSSPPDFRNGNILRLEFPREVAERIVPINSRSIDSLGAAPAERFATQGCIVFATVRNVTKLEGLSASIVMLALDVLSDASVHAAVENVIAQAGRIDILVNCAGTDHVRALLDRGMEDIEALFQTNVFGTMRVTKASFSLYLSLPAPINGNTAAPRYRANSPSKAALHSYTDTLAMDLHPFNINVLALALGMTIDARLSQDPDVMRAGAFAAKTVRMALSVKSPGHACFGG